ncbi:hypothetical protein OG21DRAFT_133840 [Imleria badia]|nr:hypothetical protein OG21DRAFT_133840 [Imleria badia]
MASTGTPIVALALTSTASSLTLDDRQNELSSSPTPSPSVASHLQLLHATNAAYPMNGWHQNHLQFYPNLSVAHLYAGQHEYVPLVESDRTSSRDTSRKASSLLDTRQWSQVPNFSASYATSGTPFNIGYPSTDVGSSRFTGSFPADGTPARGIAPELQSNETLSYKPRYRSRPPCILNKQLGCPAIIALKLCRRHHKLRLQRTTTSGHDLSTSREDKLWSSALPTCLCYQYCRVVDR